MSRHTRPYEGARVVARVTGIIRPGFGDWDGSRATVTLHEGQASHGYRTGYQHVPQRWVTVTVEGSKVPRGEGRHCWRYSGKRYAQALADFEKIAADFRRECIEVTT